MPRLPLRSVAAAAARVATVSLVALSLLGCELPEELGPDALAPTTDAGGSADTAARDTTPEVARAPVPCDVLSGQWQVSLCGQTAAAVQFVLSGCEASVTSSSPGLSGGTARLVQGVELRLWLPGGASGPLTCAAEMSQTSFRGTCVGEGRCEIVGVKAW